MNTFVGLDFAIHLKCKNKNIKLYTKNNTQNKYIKQENILKLYFWQYIEVKGLQFNDF